MWRQERSQKMAMWTDESRLALEFHNYGKLRVHRLPWERYTDCCMKEHGLYDGVRTITIRGYLPRNHFRSQTTRSTVVFQNNNTASLSRWSEARPTLFWVSRSPDLSPTEHAWGQLGRRIRDHCPVPQKNWKNCSEDQQINGIRRTSP